MMKARISFIGCIKLGIGIYIGWSIAEILDKAIGKAIDRYKAEENKPEEGKQSCGM